MNHGYYPEEDDPEIPLHEDARPWKHQARMYHDLVATGLADRDPSGLRLLDVGSGRGGGAAHLARALGFARVDGLEVSIRQAEFCGRRHETVDHLGFTAGSALRIPFADGAFDVVTNVESLHCYPDAGRFFDEVGRVLVPGGLFLCTDIFEGPPAPAVVEAMERRFEVVETRDVTERVALACLADSARFPEVLAGRVREETLRYLVHLFRSKFLLYHDRSHTYHRWILRRN